jgi:hypothetical protein
MVLGEEEKDVVRPDDVGGDEPGVVLRDGG